MKIAETLYEYKDLLPIVTETIENILRSNFGERYFFREKTIVDEILMFLFRERPIITDMNRYEWVYQLNAKASIIAQGWMINCASEVEHYEDTFDNIVDYIEMTYGTHRREYAA
jgi:hypothetical protein